MFRFVKEAFINYTKGDYSTRNSINMSPRTHSDLPPSYESEFGELRGDMIREHVEEDDDYDDYDDESTKASARIVTKQAYDRPVELSSLQQPSAFGDGNARYAVASSSRHRANQLSLPVILPQRRPKDRSRGFVRAYAPDLARCGIDQEMFLRFIDDFNNSTGANPMLLTINLASWGVQMAPIPSAIAMAAGGAIHYASFAAMELQARLR